MKNIQKINILGEKYSVAKTNSKEDLELFVDSHGTCNKYRERILIDDPENRETLEKLVKRHEIVHAFIKESGLEHSEIDTELNAHWIASQFPKMLKIFEKVEAIIRENNLQQREINMNKTKILGTTYKVCKTNSKEDSDLAETSHGTCNKYQKKILIDDNIFPDHPESREAREKLVKRHEIIHGFIQESGLEHSEIDSELNVHWIASQFPKMLKVFEKADAL